MADQKRALLTALGKDPRLHVHNHDPINLETPLAALEGGITPTPLFFVRNNDSFPQIAPEDWRLRIDGLVRRPLTIDYATLRRMPAIGYVAVLQCSGLRRSDFALQGALPEGIAWRSGAVGNAEWVGVPVRDLLALADVDATALQAECIGGDAGRTTRGVEVAKLMEDAILAYAMNGAPLPAIHGGPVRLLVPGWGGINSIKWIIGLRLIDHESPSVYNQQKYVIEDAAGQRQGKVRAIGVNAVFSWPSPDQRLTAGPVAVRGYAWAPGGIARVEVSTDDGTTWQPARLMADLGPRAWRQWQWIWQAPAGTHVLAVRATATTGEQQPTDVAYNRQGYLMNAIQRIRVSVLPA